MSLSPLIPFQTEDQYIFCCLSNHLSILQKTKEKEKAHTTLDFSKYLDSCKGVFWLIFK